MRVFCGLLALLAIVFMPLYSMRRGVVATPESVRRTPRPAFMPRWERFEHAPPGIQQAELPDSSEKPAYVELELLDEIRAKFDRGIALDCSEIETIAMVEYEQLAQIQGNCQLADEAYKKSCAHVAADCSDKSEECARCEELYQKSFAWCRNAQASHADTMAAANEFAAEFDTGGRCGPLFPLIEAD